MMNKAAMNALYEVMKARPRVRDSSQCVPPLATHPNPAGAGSAASAFRVARESDRARECCPALNMLSFDVMVMVGVCLRAAEPPVPVLSIGDREHGWWASIFKHPLKNATELKAAFAVADAHRRAEIARHRRTAGSTAISL